MTDKDERNELMAGFWVAFISWAFGNEKIRNEFEEQSVVQWPSIPKTAIEAMIDSTTGIKNQYILEFIEWVTKTYWGEEYAPKVYFEKFKSTEETLE